MVDLSKRLREVTGLHSFAELFGFSWEDGSDWTWHDVACAMADAVDAATAGAGTCHIVKTRTDSERMTDEQRRRIHDITYSTEDREELAERIVRLEDENAKLASETVRLDDRRVGLHAEVERLGDVIHRQRRQLAEVQDALERRNAECRTNIGAVHVAFETVAEYQRENDKLRELVRDYHTFLALAELAQPIGSVIAAHGHPTLSVKALDKRYRELEAEVD